MVRNITLNREAYPSEKVLLWAITSQEVTNCIADGYIPQITLPNISSEGKPKIAVILAQDTHPDRIEKDYTVFPDYVNAVLINGGYPIFIAYDKVQEQLEASSPDGILLLGGNFRLIKQDGKDYEPRPKAYVTMIEYAKEHNLPLFAICGGEQMLAVYFGASVKCNINPPTTEKYSKHMQNPYKVSHDVFLKENSHIRKVIQSNCISTNSCHNTAVEIQSDNQDLIISGKSEDGVVEVVELRNPWNEDFIIGVQWHPERLLKLGKNDSQKLFKSFVEASRKVKKNER